MKQIGVLSLEEVLSITLARARGALPVRFASDCFFTKGVEFNDTMENFARAP
jgi:hypothetical protein